MKQVIEDCYVTSLQSQSLEESNNQLQENMDNIFEEEVAYKSKNKQATNLANNVRQENQQAKLQIEKINNELSAVNDSHAKFCDHSQRFGQPNINLYESVFN